MNRGIRRIRGSGTRKESVSSAYFAYSAVDPSCLWLRLCRAVLCAFFAVKRGPSATRGQASPIFIPLASSGGEGQRGEEAVHDSSTTQNAENAKRIRERETPPWFSFRVFRVFRGFRLTLSLHCNSPTCSQAARIFQQAKEPRNTRNTRKREPCRAFFPRIPRAPRLSPDAFSAFFAFFVVKVSAFFAV